jgi:flagellar basal-body rod protein FlgF
METPGYATLTRQSGLMREMRAIATNMANMSTTGYRARTRRLCRISQPAAR